MIENNIFQIYHDKSLIPKYVSEHIKELNPKYNYKIIDFEEGKEIIENSFKYNNSLKEKILHCIDNYPRYCHKSDLLRYCLLYLHGGIYLDVDLKPIIEFDKMIPQNVNFFTSFGRGGKAFLRNNMCLYPITSNGILASTKNNETMLDLIKNCISNNNLFDKNPNFRGDNVFYLYEYLNEKCIENEKKIVPFEIINIKSENIYLLNHVIINYNNNITDCIIDKEKIYIIANDLKYNFKRQTSSFI
jgi:hypothetical protein